MRKPGPRDGYLPILSAEAGIGRNPPIGVASVAWHDRHLGRKVTVGVSHWKTKGRWPSDPNHDLNVRTARVTGDWAVEASEGDAVAFVAADHNIVDHKRDLWFGAPLATCWDDVDQWPNTGHGNIDAVSRVKTDRAVTCESARALDDRDLRLYTDHFLIETVYRVAPIKRDPLEGKPRDPKVRL